MEENNVMVSVVCLTYNHGRFIRQCLEGFVHQETTFSYQVIVHDDASTDDTADIIREYEKRYPDIIVPVYESENQYSKHTGITKNIIMPIVKGKYIAYCEGDDYWCDPKKLQLQVDAMEANTDCSACYHKVVYVNTECERTGRVVPLLTCSDKKMTQDEYMNYTFYPEKIRCFPWHISSLMVRTEIWKEYLTNPPEYRTKFDVGDQPLFFFIGQKGLVYYISKEMSCYRRNGNVNSWLGRTLSDKCKMRQHFLAEGEALAAVDEATDYRYHEAAEKGINNHWFRVLRIDCNYKEMKKPPFESLYKTIPLTTRIYYRLHYIFPGLETIKNRLTGHA